MKSTIFAAVLVSSFVFLEGGVGVGVGHLYLTLGHLEAAYTKGRASVPPSVTAHTFCTSRNSPIK